MPSNQEHIGIDFDGVIADVNLKVIEVINKTYNLTLTYKDLYHWDLQRVFGLDLYKDIGFEEILCSQDLPEVPGAFIGLGQLLDRGYKVSIMTKRSGNPLKAVSTYLNTKGFGNIPVYNSDDKSAPKDLVAMLDDDTLKLIKLKKNIKAEGRAYLLTRPWNSRCLDLGRHYRELYPGMTL